MRNDFPQITKGKGLRIPHSLHSQTLQKHGRQQLQSSSSPPSPPSLLG